MRLDSFRFDCFTLTPHNRRLERNDVPVELNSRYLDALALMVREPGKLVSKDRFLEEVWRGVPVTDEALTQCIRTLRRQLGDDATRPTFIETVPKHGYRFIAPVERVEDHHRAQGDAEDGPRAASWRKWLLIGAAGTAGGAVAGIFGGIFYGLIGASQPLQAGLGAISVFLVLLSLTVVAATLGAAGVAFGIALAGMANGRAWYWSLIGGAIGGFVVGAMTKLLGLDAFNLLIGRSPGDITGGAEGVLLGGAAGLGAWLAGKNGPDLPLRRGLSLAGLAGAAAGIAIPLLGGRLMGGSLDLLARGFPGSRLRLDPIGKMFGEYDFGLLSQTVTGALEGALFCACIAGAMILARRSLR